MKCGDKAVGSFVFGGGRGVGKREVRKQVGKEMGVEVVGFDMWE